MHQYNAFSALLAVALSEANRLNARAQVAEMCKLEVSVLIASNATAEALMTGQQVPHLVLPVLLPPLTCTALAVVPFASKVYLQHVPIQ